MRLALFSLMMLACGGVAPEPIGEPPKLVGLPEGDAAPDAVPADDAVAPAPDAGGDVANDAALENTCIFNGSPTAFKCGEPNPNDPFSKVQFYWSSGGPPYSDCKAKSCPMGATCYRFNPGDGGNNGTDQVGTCL